MRVLFVIDALGEGGTERSLADIVLGLADRDVRPTIAILRSRGEEGVEPMLRERGVDVRVIGAHRSAQQVRELRRLTRDLRPDLVHSMLFASNLRARWARALGGPPLVNSVVNLSYAPERLRDPALRRWKIEAVRRLDAVTARFVDRFHAVSQPVARHAIERLGIAPDRISVVERGRAAHDLGPSMPEQSARARAILGIRDGQRVLVNLARQEHQKGLDTLLDVVALLGNDRDSDVVALQAGRSGTATPALRTLHEQLALGDRFRFLGHRKDIDVILAAADIFVFPSRYEGMPGALIEAMAAGLPIVATDIETVVGVLEPGRNALVAAVDDAPALAGACGRLLAEEALRASFGARSRELFEERYTIDRSIDAMLRLYSGVVGGR